MKVVLYILAQGNETMALTKKQFGQRFVYKSWFVRYGIVQQRYYRAAIFHSVSYVSITWNKETHPITYY